MVDNPMLAMDEDRNSALGRDAFIRASGVRQRVQFSTDVSSSSMASMQRSHKMRV
jgi:hypothetical protein